MHRVFHNNRTFQSWQPVCNVQRNHKFIHDSVHQEKKMIQNGALCKSEMRNYLLILQNTKQHNKNKVKIYLKNRLVKSLISELLPKLQQQRCRSVILLSNHQLVLRNFANTRRTSTFWKRTLAKPPSCINQTPLHYGKTVMFWAGKPYLKRLVFHI